jgi:hypothetical protein
VLGKIKMTPKEELIQAVQQSPDNLVQALLELLKVLQQQPPKSEELTQPKTVLERMGGEPKHMLSVGGLSDRDHRRDVIAAHLQKKYKQDT